MMQIAIGVIVGTFGVHGELKVKPLADDAVFRCLKKCSVSSDTMEEKIAAVVGKRLHKGSWLIKLSGVDTPEEAALLKGARLYIPLDKLPETGADEVYWFAIAGADVYDEKDARVGILADYIETGACDVFQISGDDGVEYLISNNPEHVLHIDPAEKMVKIMRAGLVAAN